MVFIQNKYRNWFRKYNMGPKETPNYFFWSPHKWRKTRSCESRQDQDQNQTKPFRIRPRLLTCCIGGSARVHLLFGVATVENSSFVNLNVFANFVTLKGKQT